MKKIKIINEVIEYNELKVGDNFIIIDEVVYSGLTDDGWKSIECEDVDIILERDKAIEEEKNKENMPKRLVQLEAENLELMLVITELYEMNL